MEDSSDIPEFVTDCGCTGFIVPRNARSIRFGGLENDVKYFPMIYESADASFCGLPPPSIKPNHQVSEMNTLTNGPCPTTLDLDVEILWSQSFVRCLNYQSSFVNTSEIRKMLLHTPLSAKQPVGKSSSSVVSGLSSDSSSSNTDDASKWHKSREEFNDDVASSVISQKQDPGIICMDRYLHTPAKSLPNLETDRLADEWWGKSNKMLKQEKVAWRSWKRETLERASFKLHLQT